MAVYVACLRAVNVGGTGKLAMADLRALCEGLGFEAPQTYIQSGNVVFSAKGAAHKVRSALADALAAHVGKPIGVFVRTGAELDAILAANPVPGWPGARLLIVLRDEPPAPGWQDRVRHLGDERIEVRGREMYVAYSETGIGRSRMRCPDIEAGTARNLNTIERLASMARART